MKPKFLYSSIFVFLWVSSLLWGNADITHLLITTENNATPLLEKLLILGDVKEKNLQDIVAKTQANWIVIRQGQGGLERRDLVDGEKQKAIARKVFDLSERLGLFSPYSPENNHYDYAICLGAFFDTSKKRLERLISLWNEGIRFDSLVFLGGDRLLREEEKVYLQMECSTEYDMLIALWEMELNALPPGMQESLKGDEQTPYGARGV